MNDNSNLNVEADEEEGIATPNKPGAPGASGKPPQPKDVLDLYDKGFGLAVRATAEKNWPQWSASTLFMMLDLAYRSRARIPRLVPLVLGTGGIGKSSIVRFFANQKAKEEGRTHAVDWESLNEDQQLAACKDPSDYFFIIDKRPEELDQPEVLLGIPHLSKVAQHGTTVFAPPTWVKVLHHPKFSGIVFMDELNRCEKSTLNYLMKFVLDGKIGGSVVSKGCTLCAAGNWSADGTFGALATLDPAQLRRFGAGVLVIDPKEWELHAKKAGINRYIIDFAMIEPDENLFGKSVDLINGNVPINPAQLDEVSWIMNEICDVYKARRDENKPLPYGYPQDIIEALANALPSHAGTDWVNKFVQWLRTIRKFKWEEIIADAKAGKYKTKPGAKAPEEITGATKYSFIRYCSDKVKEDWHYAYLNKDAAEKRRVVVDLTDLLKNVDSDLLFFIITKLYEEVKEFNPDIIQAANEWGDLWTRGVALHASKTDPEFFKRLQAQMIKMAKQKDPEAEEKLKKTMADQEAARKAAGGATPPPAPTTLVQAPEQEQE